MAPYTTLREITPMPSSAFRLLCLGHTKQQDVQREKQAHVHPKEQGSTKVVALPGWKEALEEENNSAKVINLFLKDTWVGAGDQ